MLNLLIQDSFSDCSKVYFSCSSTLPVIMFSWDDLLTQIIVINGMNCYNCIAGSERTNVVQSNALQSLMKLELDWQNVLIVQLEAIFVTLWLVVRPLMPQLQSLGSHVVERMTFGKEMIASVACYARPTSSYKDQEMFLRDYSPQSNIYMMSHNPFNSAQL